MMNKQSGFTLTELIVVMLILAALAVGSVRISRSFISTQQISSDTNVVSGQLYLAQNNALSNKNNSDWGVNISSNTVTVFSGSTYATRDTSQDKLQTLSNFTNVSGSTSIVFTNGSGVPDALFSVNLSNTLNGTNISVNGYGTISIN